MLVRLTKEQVLEFFRMLDNTIGSSGTLFINDCKIRVRGDKGKAVFLLDCNYYSDVIFPAFELTKEDIENMKNIYMQYVFTKYRIPDLYIVKYELDKLIIEFIFDYKTYVKQF